MERFSGLNDGGGGQLDLIKLNNFKLNLHYKLYENLFKIQINFTFSLIEV